VYNSSSSVLTSLRVTSDLQELQRDIEQHAAGVSSVLALCEVLLRDRDACSGRPDRDSLQQTCGSLDRRWRNICSMSVERRVR